MNIFLVNMRISRIPTSFSTLNTEISPWIFPTVSRFCSGWKDMSVPLSFNLKKQNIEEAAKCQRILSDAGNLIS